MSLYIKKNLKNLNHPVQLMVQGPLQVRVFFPMKYKKITITIIYEVYPQNQGGNLYIKLLLISISQKITFS